jgi:hypothetical protein
MHFTSRYAGFHLPGWQAVEKCFGRHSRTPRGGGPESKGIEILRFLESGLRRARNDG